MNDCGSFVSVRVNFTVGEYHPAEIVHVNDEHCRVQCASLRNAVSHNFLIANIFTYFYLLGMIFNVVFEDVECYTDRLHLSYKFGNRNCVKYLRQFQENTQTLGRTI